MKIEESDEYFKREVPAWNSKVCKYVNRSFYVVSRGYLLKFHIEVVRSERWDLTHSSRRTLFVSLN